MTSHDQKSICERFDTGSLEICLKTGLNVAYAATLSSFEATRQLQQQPLFTLFHSSAPWLLGPDKRRVDKAIQCEWCSCGACLPSATVILPSPHHLPKPWIPQSFACPACCWKRSFFVFQIRFAGNGVMEGTGCIP